MKGCVAITLVAFLAYSASVLASFTAWLILRSASDAFARSDLLSHLPNCVSYDQGAILTVSALLPALALSVIWSLGIWDLLLDVISYAANTRRRKNVVETLSDIISGIDKSRNGVPLILVGHSLGSVVLTQAMPTLTEGPAVLVTCGSPLNMMARAFPPIVPSSEKIASQIFAQSRIRQWVNVYRDADYIGRSLRINRVPGFYEASIGDGGHTGYFSDVSFWTAVLNLVWSKSSLTPSKPPLLSAASSPDKKERSNLRDLAWLSALVGILTAILDTYICCTFILPDGAVSLLCISFPFVLACIAGSAACLVALAAIWLFLRSRWGKFTEVPISEFRLWRSPLWST